MPSGANAFAWVATLDTSNVTRATAILAGNFQQISDALFKMGRFAENASFTKATNEWMRASEHVQRLKNNLVELREAQDALNAGGGRGRLRDDQVGSRVLQTVQAQRSKDQGKDVPIPKAVKRDEIIRAVQEAKVGIEEGTQAMDEFGRSALTNASYATDAFGQVIQATTAFRTQMEELALLLSGGLDASFVLTASRVIEQEILKIKTQLADLDEVVNKQRDHRTQARRSQAGKLTVRGNEELATAARLEEQIVGLKEQQLVASVKGIAQTEKQKKQLTELRQKQDAANKNARQFANDAKELNKEVEGDRKTSGISKEYDELTTNLAELEKRQEALYDPNQTKEMQSALQAQRQELEEIQAAIKSEVGTLEERNARIQEAAVKTRALKTETEALAKRQADGAKALPAERHAAAQQKELPGINRLFTNISKDLSRRFIATLQFAVSGALIFGVQKFVREFIKGAIEVERAFADIESALEFDIDVPRGALEFRLKVEEVRREVLLLSNQFNVLPTDANKAAFVMISRFTETGNALKALRAHLLATKISTIDQSETLRALTAVAEGFTASILEVNENMSLQESLFRRETVSATLYIRALDLAVQIQQKFGVEVEDTLEGGARATEVFRQMGFTMEETFAIVAATSRQLGQTGGQVAERLNRSLGQLTDPKIRDSLLALSGTTESFTLQISDFESGAKAWKKISDEFVRLEKVAPSAARQILQIVGQRRELEAVAAALGTADLQEAIISGADQAAGSAEARFAFLSVTVDEMFKSIGAGMEELAQNFERLGGLTTFKILLTAVDKLVTGLNAMLKFLIDVRDAMNSILNNGVFGSMVFQAGALTLALAGTLRVLFEIHRVYDKIAKSKALGSALNFLDIGGGRTVAGSAASGGLIASLGASISASFASARGIFASGAAIGATGPLGSVGGVIAGGASLGAVGGIKAVAAIKAAQVALTAFIPVWGQVGIAALALGAVLNSSAKAFKNFENDLEDWITSIGNTTSAARRDALQEGLEPGSAASDQFILREQIRGAQEKLNSGDLSSVGGFGSGLAQIFGAVTGGFDNQRDSFDDPGAADLADVFRGINTPSSIPGHKEYVQLQIDKMNLELLNVVGQELLNNVASADFDESDHEFLDTIKNSSNVFARKIIDSDLIGGDILGAARRFMNEAIQEQIDFANSGGTEGEIRANTAIAGAEIDRLGVQWNEFVSIFGELPAQLIKSVQQLNTELGHLPTQVSLGEISDQAANTRTLEIAKELADRAAKLRDDINGPADIEAADAADRDAEEATLAYLEGRKTIMANYVRNATRFLGPREALEVETRQLNKEIENLIRKGFSAGAYRAQSERLLDIAKEQASTIRQVKLSEAQLAVSLSRNFEARAEAMKAQIFLLRKQAIQFIFSNKELNEQLRAQADALQLTLDKETASEGIRLAVAKFRAGKKRDPRTELEAQIIGLQATQNSEFASIAEKQEATNAIVDALRAIQGVEIQRLTALALSRVSVRDSINEQLVALSSLRQEVDLAINVYGLSSKAHLDLARQIKQAEAALIDATLDMESVNRQLSGGFDVTNPLQNAEENFIRIARQLQIPDLGDAERAALELELKNSEAARIGASFNEGLFQLKFQFERGTIGQSEYISALKGMLAATDLTTHQGQELWLQINALIEGLTDDLSGAAFNIPGEIRLPTLFEVRRAVQAESMGVNYLDNRQQDINVYVSSEVQLGAVMSAIESVFDVQDASMAPGGAGITMGVF